MLSGVLKVTITLAPSAVVLPLKTAMSVKAPSTSGAIRSVSVDLPTAQVVALMQSPDVLVEASKQGSASVLGWPQSAYATGAGTGAGAGSDTAS